MNARFFDRIDWAQPWLATLKFSAMPVLQAADWRQEINAATGRMGLKNHRGLPIQFVRQSDLPPGCAYEAFISATGCIPTRDNLHDFFNALVWLTYPRLKAQLNALQAAEIANSIGTPNLVKAGATSRGELRDAATIFDENAALLITGDMELVAALREHRWRDVFMTRRAAFWRDCDVFLFGHALMEKLESPYKAITAHAWVVAADATFFALAAEDKRAWIDATGAQRLTGGLATTDFTPLPVLGVPDWWRCQDEGFYADIAVFRAKRDRTSPGTAAR